MRKFVYTILILLVLIPGAVFVVLNPNPVSVDLLVAQYDMSLAVVVLVSVVLGIILSMLFFSLKLVSARSKNHKLQKKVSDAEEELAGIRQRIVEASH